MHAKMIFYTCLHGMHIWISRNGFVSTASIGILYRLCAPMNYAPLLTCVRQLYAFLMPISKHTLCYPQTICWGNSNNGRNRGDFNGIYRKILISFWWRVQNFEINILLEKGTEPKKADICSINVKRIRVKLFGFYSYVCCSYVPNFIGRP